MAQATTVTPLDHLVKVLKLGEPSAYRNHTYINGESMYFPTGRVYGGQVIAQSVIAASKTVGPSRLPHSVHGYFIAAGDIRQDLLFDVENLRDGRSFSARRVNVTQAEGSILTAIASFQETGQEGVEFADPMPENLPDPETLTSAKELMQPFAEKSPFANYYAEKSPFDIRHVTPTVMLRADKDSAEHDSGKQMVWMKADGHVDVPQVMHRAMLALGCDQVMMEPVLRRAGLSISTPGISYASIDIRCGGIRYRYQRMAFVCAGYAYRRARTRTRHCQSVCAEWRLGGGHRSGSYGARAVGIVTPTACRLGLCRYGAWLP
mgnify:CR=1 FL=1